ncbi:MAG TPA: hypothetical protein VNS81_09985 [Nocardioides sp.]|nr:hypothetical protein [Nocardioides sp.]
MSYQPYEAPGEPGASRVESGPWQVAVEYSNQGDAKPPTIVQVGSSVFARREQALAAARQTAFEYAPPDPWSPQGRRVWGDGPDGFLVVIEGATTTFHMSVRVVQYLGEVAD